MTLTVLTDKAQDSGTYIVTLAWTDEAGTAVTPTTATWELSDRAGTTINSRTAVTIGSLSTTNYIVLIAADLAFSDAPFRRLEVRFTYTSATHGALSQRIEYEIEITDHANS